MGILNWWQNRRKPKRNAKRKVKNRSDPIELAFGRVKRDFNKLKAQSQSLQQHCDQHDRIIEDHSQQLQDQRNRFQKLEERLGPQLPHVPLELNHPLPEMIDLPAHHHQSISRPTEPTNRPVATKTVDQSILSELDMDRFSNQEKKILSVFLSHRQMALSYCDVAKTLNKSPHTVKNQVRQIMTKSNLFEKFVDNQQKNRFKLKPNLKVKASLDHD